MKTINSIKFIGSIIAIAAFIMILKSCKKADIAPKDAQTTRAAAIKAIKAKYGDVSAGIVYNINKTATEYFYKDANGQRVSLYGKGNNKPGGTNGITTSCMYDCSTAPKPSDLTIDYTLDYAERFYICESNGDYSTVNVKWTVSVPFAIAPFSIGSTFSTGYLQFTDAFATTTTFYAPYTDMTITYISATPGCSTNSLYEVSYQIPNVPNSNFVSGTTLAAAVDLANNCSLVYNLVSSAYMSAPTFSQDGYLPCNRIDKVYINPYTGPSSCATADGNYKICNYPTGLTPVDYQEVEYRKVTASTGSLKWEDQEGTTPVSVVYWGEPAFTFTPDARLSPYGTSNLVNILPSSGTWLIRYRNVKTSVCDLIYSGGTNPSPGPANANGDWLNPALWFVEALTP